MTQRLIFVIGAIALLNGCASVSDSPSGTAHVAILGINDFHGHIQSEGPVPRVLDLPDPASPDKRQSVPTGGLAYLSTEIALLRTQNPHSITVGVGDLIGASPISSSLLDDEPAIEAMNRIGMSVSVVGNHEFDNGRASLERRIRGECPKEGCKLPEFHGAKFAYLGANVIDRNTQRPVLPPYVIREIDGVKVAFVGTPLHDIPSMVMAAGISSISFADEADTINALVPEIRAKGAKTIVALIHQGGDYNGPFNDPTYECKGLTGPIVDLTKRINPSVKVVMSAHTHNAYTCKVDGRLVTQGYSYGSLVSEIRLNIDRASGELVSADATNHLVDQRILKPDPAMQKFVADVARMTDSIRSAPVGAIETPLTRTQPPGGGDSTLGRLIADAQLAYAKRFGQADVAFMNNGGIRADLPNTSKGSGEPTSLTFGDLYAVQPFRNSVVVMSLTGEQILQVLRNQWRPDYGNTPYFLQISRSMTYRWNPALPVAERISDVRINGVPLEAARVYRVAMNGFLAGGGDHTEVFTQGKDAAVLPGFDVDALRWYIETTKEGYPTPRDTRITRIP